MTVIQWRKQVVFPLLIQVGVTQSFVMLDITDIISEPGRIGSSGTDMTKTFTETWQLIQLRLNNLSLETTLCQKLIWQSETPKEITYLPVLSNLS